MLASYFMVQFYKKGLEVRKLFLSRLIDSNEGSYDLFSAIDKADIIIFVCPLYLDSPSALVIKAMELIARKRELIKQAKKQKLFVISCCGFPEARQNSVALTIYRRFALEAGFEWLGGFEFGMGGVLEHKFRKFWFMLMRNVKKAIKLAVDAICKGKPVSKEAIILISKPCLPVWLYVYMNKFWLKCELQKNGISDKLNSPPYQTLI
jgi:hypothetical protein